MFVAIFPPVEVREALLDAVMELPVRGKVRWNRPEAVHLTLKFLGEVSEDATYGIQSALENVCEQYAPFEVETSGFGAFPSNKRARVIWSGVGEGFEPLRSLAAEVEDSLERLGFERERRGYVPHITLGRARGRPVALDLAENAPESGHKFTASRVELVQSKLQRSGAVYSTVAACPFSEG